MEQVIAYADMLPGKNQRRVDLTTMLFTTVLFAHEIRASVKEGFIHTRGLTGLSFQGQEDSGALAIHLLELPRNKKKKKGRESPAIAELQQPHL